MPIRSPRFPIWSARFPNLVMRLGYTDVLAPVTDVVASVPQSWWRRLLMVSLPNNDFHRAGILDGRSPTWSSRSRDRRPTFPPSCRVAPITDVVAPVTDGLTQVIDVIAPGQYMPTSVAGAVVPLTRPPSDLRPSCWASPGWRR